jgi:hypothetical protein
MHFLRERKKFTFAGLTFFVALQINWIDAESAEKIQDSLKNQDQQKLLNFFYVNNSLGTLFLNIHI